jgi:hypothetical protein
MTTARRGEIWMVDLDPTLGHEQAGKRPALVLSVDSFNASPADLVTVLPVTSKARAIRTRIPITPPEGGLGLPSYVIPAPRAGPRTRHAGDDGEGGRRRPGPARAVTGASGSEHAREGGLPW